METTLNNNYAFSNVVGKFCEFPHVQLVNSMKWKAGDISFWLWIVFFGQVIMKNVVQYNLFV